MTGRIDDGPARLLTSQERRFVGGAVDMPSTEGTCWASAAQGETSQVGLNAIGESGAVRRAEDIRKRA